MKQILIPLLLPFLLFNGCRVEDQTIIPKAYSRIVNPPPASLDFRGSNARHRLLVAVVGTGTDYRHPDLAKSIHYQISPEGEAVGAGYDFIGQDAWPAPYFLRTDYLNSQVTEELRAKSKVMKQNLEKLAHLLKSLFGLSFDPLRLHEVESGNHAWHETHVAGLMIYNQPSIGLLPYRTYPAPKLVREGRELEYLESNLILIELALRRAVLDGARVINISLGANHEATESGFAVLRDFQKKFQKIAEENPGVAFVAAAGNESKFVDGKNMLALPCAVAAGNWLCVGAVDESGNPSAFTNYTSAEFRFALATGQEMRSTYPEGIIREIGDLASLSEPTFENRNFVARIAQKISLSSSSYFGVAGTSQAAPLVARQIALEMLIDPAVSGKAAIDHVIRKGAQVPNRPEWRAIQMDLPSW